MASKDMSNHTPGRREPGLRANVLRRAYLAYRPVDVTSRSALPLKDFHQLIDKLETPNCVQVAARREWDPAIVQFKRDIRAFFQEARPGSGVSLDWSKLLFIYPEPKRGHESWQDAQTAEGGRWSKSERTGQVWFLVRLAVELENIDSLNGVDEPEDLNAIRHDLEQVKLTLLGYRAAAVLEDNARRAADHHRRYPHRPSPHLYSFPDFLDLLRSIRPPLPLKAASGAEEDDEAFDPEEADEFARFIATYQATLESQIGGESEWNKMQAFRFVPGVGQDAVLGCFHLGNLVLTDKLAIEAGEYTVELIHEMCGKHCDAIAWMQKEIAKLDGSRVTSAPRMLFNSPAHAQQQPVSDTSHALPGPSDTARRPRRRSFGPSEAQLALERRRAQGSS